VTSAPPTQPPASPSPGTPTTGTPSPDGGTGAAILDEVIAAVESGDVAAIEALVNFQPRPCTTESAGAGGPPVCDLRTGEPDGTPVNVVQISTCEGGWLREGDFNLQGLEPQELEYEGAYRTGESPVYTEADAEYAALFFREGQPAGTRWGVAFLTDDEGIVRIDFGCGEEVDGFLQLRGYPEAEPLE
jgi:hypothetical protein